MAVNMKKMLAKALLELNEHKNLDAITIQNLLDHTGVSRQTFYNHFKDKNDLIQYIYEIYIIPDFGDYTKNINFELSMYNTLVKMKDYRNFLKQACMMEGQNCLKEYMFKHCQEFDLKWHEHFYGSQLPESLHFATIYHSTASTSMTLSWILSDMVVSCRDMAHMITTMRSIGMDVLFEQGQKNPYSI